MLTGLKIEEITDEIQTPLSAMPETSSSESSAMKTKESSKDKNSQSENTSGTSVLPTNTEYLQALKDDKESIRFVFILTFFKNSIVPIFYLHRLLYVSTKHQHYH